VPGLSNSIVKVGKEKLLIRGELQTNWVGDNTSKEAERRLKHGESVESPIDTKRKLNRILASKKDAEEPWYFTHI